MSDPENDKPQLFELPKFPTAFGEKEQRRLEELEAQKRQMQEIFKTKFSPDAWKQVSLPERATRKLLADTNLVPFVKAITPWQWGWDFGFTPEQHRAEVDKVATEYKELARRERVTGMLPTVMESIRNLALSNESLITDIDQLKAIFKLDKLGFTDEEAGFVAQYARSLINAPPEALVSGEPWGIR